MDEQLFFVGIREHQTVRKDLLQSSKMLLDSLKRHELYRRVKEDKLRAVNDLKRVFDELLILNKKFRGKLPKVPVKVPDVPMREEPRPQALPKGAKSSPLKQEKLQSSSKSKLDLLEEELAKVEARLGGLE